MKACSKARSMTSSISMDTISPPGNASVILSFLSVYSHRRRRREAAEGADAADAVPGVFGRGRLTLAFVAFLEARDEELLGQGGQHHPAGLAIVHHLVGVVEIDHLGDGAGLGGVV